MGNKAIKWDPMVITITELAKKKAGALRRFFLGGVHLVLLKRFQLRCLLAIVELFVSNP